MDIATLQKTCLVHLGTLRENDFMLYLQGKGTDRSRDLGMGFAVKNTILKMVELSSDSCV